MSIHTKMIDQAKQAMTRAHAPYSQFKVGVCLLADDGQLYQGCNVENAAFPEGTCAEAGAIAAMVLAGAKHIQSAVIVCDHPIICPPCGGCRQKFNEFMAPDGEIHCVSLNGEHKTFTLADLLPFSFTQQTMEHSS